LVWVFGPHRAKAFKRLSFPVATRVGKHVQAVIVSVFGLAGLAGRQRAARKSVTIIGAMAHPF